MNRKHRSTLSLQQLESRLAPAAGVALTWQGDVSSVWNGISGTNTNWTNSLNGNPRPADNVSLIFPAAAGNKSNTNDISGLDLKSLSFTGDGYAITGQPITLSTGITGNWATAGTNSFVNSITLRDNQTFAFTGNTDGQFNLGLIDLGGQTLTINNQFAVFTASNATKITGSGSIVKQGLGTLRFPTANDFAGTVDVQAGGALEVHNVGSLGAVGTGNGTTVSGNNAAVVFLNSVIGTVNEDFTIRGFGGTNPGAITLSGGVTGTIITLAGALRLSASATVAGTAAGNDRLTLAGQVGAADDGLAVLTIDTASLTSFNFAATATVHLELAAPQPGFIGHDQLKFIGPANLGNVPLNVVPSITPEVGSTFTIVDNDGADAIVGTFAGLAEGATFSTGGVNFSITYAGGDGNDVVLTVDSLVEVPVDVTLSGDGKTATYTDVDGDLVTVKTDKGPFLPTDFRIVEAGVGGQLQLLNLSTRPDDFQSANITITAKPGPLGGTGFANVGYLNANGIDLGSVIIPGDLGRIVAGTVGGDAKIPALKSLAADSMGVLGISTQAAGGSDKSAIDGAVVKLSLKGDLRSRIEVSGSDGRLGSAVIGGSFTPSGTGLTAGIKLAADAGIGSLRIGGDIRVGDTNGVAIESAKGSIGSVTVLGAIAGTGPGREAFLSAANDIGSLKVGGSVEFTNISAGEDLGSGRNLDALIGSINVGGDWIASDAVAGVVNGGDGHFGNNNDSQPFSNILIDEPNRFSTIGSFTVKGQAFGTAGTTSDMFGIVAQRINKAKVGVRTFNFKPDTNDAFFAAPTLDGVGNENPMYDFTIRELGSSTPTVALGGANLVLSADGKTATFIDVDGDLVTVKRNIGVFALADFDIVEAASGGGLLEDLDVNGGVGSPPVNLSITAKVGPNGGNGYVNVGDIRGNDVLFGNVVIAGEVETFGANGGDPLKIGLASLTIQSLGELAGTGFGTDGIIMNNSIGKVFVKTDSRGDEITTSGTIGSVRIGGAMVDTEISADLDIGSIRIGGTMRDFAEISGFRRIGSIAIGGDLVGSGTGSSTIKIRAGSPGPAAGIDFGLKSFTVKGSVIDAEIRIGDGDNADASIGTISVGRGWLGSNLFTGIDRGADNLIGTPDDTKDFGIDVPTRFSAIGSLVIKGQALGSAASGDSFGIVAEQINAARVGKRTFVFDKGERDAADAFNLAPTGSGFPGVPFDFFVREIVA